MQTVSSLIEGRTKVISSNSLFTVPLFSLRSPSSARDKKIKNRRRYIDRQRKGVRVGKKNIDSSFFFFFSRSALVLVRSPMFLKRTNRPQFKTTLPHKTIPGTIHGSIRGGIRSSKNNFDIDHYI